ncbi:hypothetical protein DdX_13244 [Ditylenchus destructor]|uniref:Uncharacterized protein n=1 Tax=Ditylenchus destructor TaxID=166010 RepID=A0AAD4MUV3_9BILA|nr:hypothetical protein DdX_13244 [Ditylenchus destructor]
MSSSATLEEAFDQTVTVTIALESAVHDLRETETHMANAASTSDGKAPNPNDPPPKKGTPEDMRRIGPRTHPREVCPEVRPELMIGHLTAQLAKVIELRLNPPALGTLKNWEFLCAHLGSSLDEINNMRRSDNPTGQLLKFYKEVPLARLLEIFCDMNRVDVLISIQDGVKALNDSEAGKGSKSYYGYDIDSETVYSCSSTSSSNHTTKRERRELKIEKLRKELDGFRVILVLHHEENENLVAFCRMLLYNLKRSIEKCKLDYKILDVDKCVDEENLISTAQEIYDNSDQIVVVLSEDYSRSVVHPGNMTENVSARLQVKRLLHAQTNIEYARNGMKNERFRIVRLQGTPDSLRPNGWASNTLCYLFPDMFTNLCESLFNVRNTRSGTRESDETVSLQSTES